MTRRLSGTTPLFKDARQVIADVESSQTSATLRFSCKTCLYALTVPANAKEAVRLYPIVCRTCQHPGIVPPPPRTDWFKGPPRASEYRCPQEKDEPHVLVRWEHRSLCPRCGCADVSWKQRDGSN